MSPLINTTNTGLSAEGAPPEVTGNGSVFNDLGTHRYLLTRSWASGGTAVFVMLNPSTADAQMDDPTIRRCVGFARREGCGGLVVVNLFALRSTDPRALTVHPDPAGPENDAVILEWGLRGGPVIAACSASGRLHRRNMTVTALLADAGVELWCLGRTADGSPRHPLYVRADASLIRLAPETTKKGG